MNPLKQRTPGDTPGHDEKIYEVTSSQDNSHILYTAQSFTCRQCAFFELITRKNGYKYGLCHFTGVHDPQPGQAGCRFIPGNWDNIDEILGLTQGLSGNSLEIPNYTRPCSGLVCSQDRLKVAKDSTAIHAYADKDGKKALHIGRAQRPHVREVAAASYRPGSVGALPFCFNHPELYEV